MYWQESQDHDHLYFFYFIFVSKHYANNGDHMLEVNMGCGNIPLISIEYYNPPPPSW